MNSPLLRKLLADAGIDITRLYGIDARDTMIMQIEEYEGDIQSLVYGWDENDFAKKYDLDDDEISDKIMWIKTWVDKARVALIESKPR